MDYGWELSTAVVLFHEAIGRTLGLSAADHKALGMITRDGPMPSGRLAEALGVLPSAVTGVVDRLERAGYVRRVADPADRRRVLVEADPAKRPDLEGVFRDLGKDMGAFTGKYDEKEMAAVVDFIENTVAVLKKHTAKLSSTR